MGSKNCRFEVGDSYAQISNLFEKKTLKKAQLRLSVKLPPKKVREQFLIIYELEGCQKAVNFLTDFCQAPKMHIILNGRMVGKRKSNNWAACYCNNKAYFTKERIEKKVVLHELYHHLIESNDLEISLRTEEKEANYFAKSFVDFLH